MERNDGNFVTHYSEEIRLLHASEKGRDVGSESLAHLGWQDRQRVLGDQAVTFESPCARRATPAQLNERKDGKQAANRPGDG